MKYRLQKACTMKIYQLRIFLSIMHKSS